MRLFSALRAKAQTSPLMIALIIQLLVISLFVMSLVSSGTVDVTTASGQPDFSFVLRGLTAEAILAVILLIIVSVLGWNKACYLTTSFDTLGLRWAIPILAVIFTLASLVIGPVIFEGTHADQSKIIFQLVLFCLAVGVFEEVLYRGTLFHGLSRHLSPFWAMMISSLIFGLFHMQNIVVGQAVGATAFQSLNAAALGVVFCAIMLQTNSIWTAIILHSGWNLVLFVSAYVAQTQPELMELSPEDIANQSTDITASAFLMPAFLLALGLLIYARWAKRIANAT